MKKLVSPLANGGAPFTNDIMGSVFNQELWTAIESILQGVSPTASSGNVGVIVSGCAVTLNGGGPNYNCTSGIVYLNGQFMAFPGFSNLALPQYIVPATLAYTTKVFQNGTTNNMISQQDATVTNTLPGSGQYIILSTTGNLGSVGGFRFENWVNAGVVKTLLNYCQSGIVSPDSGIIPGVFFAQGGTVPIGTGTVGNMIVSVNGSNIYQHYIVISGAGASAGDIYYRNSTNGGSSWSTWTLVNNH